MTVTIDEREVLRLSIALGLIVDETVGWVFIGEPFEIGEEVVATDGGGSGPIGGRYGGDERNGTDGECRCNELA